MEFLGFFGRYICRVVGKGIFLYFVIVYEEIYRNINIYGYLNVVDKVFVF